METVTGNELKGALLLKICECLSLNIALITNFNDFAHYMYVIPLHVANTKFMLQDFKIIWKKDVLYIKLIIISKTAQANNNLSYGKQ